MIDNKFEIGDFIKYENRVLFIIGYIKHPKSYFCLCRSSVVLISQRNEDNCKKMPDGYIDIWLNEIDIDIKRSFTNE